MKIKLNFKAMFSLCIIPSLSASHKDGIMTDPFFPRTNSYICVKLKNIKVFNMFCQILILSQSNVDQ